MIHAIFLHAYLQFEQRVRQCSWADLTASDIDQLQSLHRYGHTVYQEIVGQRRVGEEYLYASLSYFAGDLGQSLGPMHYLILGVSYRFYRLYLKISALPNSNAKQKEVWDLLRYISKPLLNPHLDQLQHSAAHQLFELYLQLDQAQQESSDQEFYLQWHEAVAQLNIADARFLSYVRSLGIIFKRLAQQKLVHRRRQAKAPADWPSVEKARHYQAQQRQYQIDFDGPQVVLQTYALVEVDAELESEESGILIHSTDRSTARFCQLLTDHADHMMRHRQKRLQPFVTNPAYMSEDVIERVVYLLHAEMLNSHVDEAAVAAACLLSLSSGLSAVALLVSEQLIDEGILVKDGTARRPVYWLNLRLRISQQKLIHLRAHQLNQHVTHRLYLSSSWFDAMQQRDPHLRVDAALVNNYLKRWTANAHIGSITVEKLQAQLYFYVFRDSFNEYLAHVLSGRGSEHDLPSSFYAGVAKTKLNDHYLSYLKRLHTPDFAAALEGVERQFFQDPPNQGERFGSQLALSPIFVEDFFRQLHHVYSAALQPNQHVITQLNAYAIWMWHISLLCLSRRPKENMLGALDDYDLIHKLIYIHDKDNSKSRRDGRYIPLCGFFIEAFERYVKFLADVVHAYADLWKLAFGKALCVDEVFGKMIEVPSTLPTSSLQWQSKRIHLVVLDRGRVNRYLKNHLELEIYNNWLRHVDMNLLMQQEMEFNLIQALYGHDQRHQELFYPYSSASLSGYVRQVTAQMDALVTQLSITHLDDTGKVSLHE